MNVAQERFNQVVERIQKAAQQSGRDPQKIALVAVSKAVPFDRIAPFIQAGARILGENRVQEASAKFGSGEAKTLHPNTQLHLIGHLQTNKAKKAVGLFDMVQSLDRADLGIDLNRHAGEAGRSLSCLVQVKISTEPAKEGLAPEQLDDFLAQAKAWTHLKIQGLMGIAPYMEDPENARPFFARLRALFEKTKLDVLSMGMSHDFEAAVQEGATMVRIGTALFGTRTAGTAL
jgi:pyridoxal phosphate enzyme (YggS family)